jgi:hypothetical protein
MSEVTPELLTMEVRIVHGSESNFKNSFLKKRFSSFFQFRHPFHERSTVIEK